MSAVGHASGASVTAAGPAPFRDVAGTHAAAIAAAAERGLLLGGPDGRFRPQQATRRDQAAGVLVRLLDHLATLGTGAG